MNAPQAVAGLCHLHSSSSPCVSRFYSTFAFTTPVTLLRIPYSLGISIVWSVVVYWPCNMAPEASRFFTFILILFLLHKWVPLAHT